MERTSIWNTPPISTRRLPQLKMATQPRNRSSCNEDRVILALRAIERDPDLTLRRAAAIHNVPIATLSRRRAGGPSRRDFTRSTMKLTSSEEAAIVRHVLDLATRGFPPTKVMVRDMANQLLAERGRDPIGKRWADNFLKRTPDLRTRWTRRYDRQRALTEDPVALREWFSLVEATRAQYGVLDEDTYNFDETRFAMGVVLSQLVVTGAGKRGKARLVQPGGRVWTTVIQGVGAAGVAIPPYIIFAGKNHIDVWYDHNNTTIPGDWVIGVSDSG